MGGFSATPHCVSCVGLLRFRLFEASRNSVKYNVDALFWLWFCCGGSGIEEDFEENDEFVEDDAEAFEAHHPDVHTVVQGEDGEKE